MVRINNTFEFSLYSWDTLESVAERLAANDNINTLPKYLYLPTGEDPIPIKKLREKEDVQIEDFLDYMQKQDVMSLPGILSNLDSVNFFIKKRLDIMVDIIAPFIAYNSILEKIGSQEREALFLLLKNKITDRVIPFNRLWRDRDNTIRMMKRRIEDNKNKVNETQLLVVTQGFAHSEFIRQEVSLRLEFDFQGLTLLEVFDKIKLTPKVPFVSANNLYKILRDFTPDPNWGSMDGNIYFQFLATPPSEDPKFIDAVMVVEEEKGILETGSIKYKYGMTSNDFYSNLEDIFQPRLPLNVTNSTIISEKGNFYYRLGSEPIDAYVLGDLVLNNPLFNQYLAIDEHESATKGKRSSMYIHFFGSSGDSVKAYITVYQVREKDEVHEKYNYPIGEYYLYVLVKNVKSKSSLEEFTIIFGKLLALYYKEASKIIKIYQDLLPVGTFPPKFRTRKPFVKNKKIHKTLKEQAPEVFVSGYPTKCGNQPRIISAEEAKESKNIVMQYPKTATEGFPQRWYVCDVDKTHPYPGLRVNDLSNNNLVPYLPCCFKTPQDLGREGEVGKQSKPYAHYFYDVPVLTGITGTQQNILTRDLFTNPPKVAVLPKELEEMLNLVTYKQGWSFVRSGVFDSKASFLECVLEALQEYSDEIAELLMYDSEKVREADAAVSKAKKRKYRKDIITKAEGKLWEAKKEERIELINKLREKFATPSNATGCRQEMYDYTDDEILQVIRDPNVYFDPRLLTNLVEKLFKCKIILFSRVSPGLKERTYKTKLNTSLTLPRHVQAYYKTKEKVPTILIYERLGRGTEQKEYPRCELISYWDGALKATSIHKAGSIVSQEMGILYERVRESYNLNCLISETILPLNILTNIGIKFTHQEIDSYGKCRSLIFKYKSETGIFLVTPIQPLLLPHFEEPVTPRLSLDTVNDILKKINVKPVKKTISGRYISAYSGIIGNVRFSLPFEQSEDTNKDLIIENDLVRNDQLSSKLNMYNRDKKIARYMVEYMRWLYSNFLSDKNIEDSIESLQEFINTRIKVDEKFNYGLVAKTFNKNSGMTIDGVLYVKSNETKKRLIYTLQLYALQQPEELKKYKSRTIMSNYYTNIGDFTRYRSQVILQGDNAVLKWINEREQDYSLHNDVIISERIKDINNVVDELSSRIENLKILGSEKELQEQLEEQLEDLELEYEELYSLSLNTPRFFKNSLVGNNQMYLYQQTVGLPQALKISRKWKKKIINDSKNVNDSDDKLVPEEDFTLYSYKSPTNITSYLCDDNSCIVGKSDEITLLGYKNSYNEPTFISLLPLGICNR
jgi:antitoxin component of RelBE/YafQ-DinJ toxin-antitoxin module